MPSSSRRPSAQGTSGREAGGTPSLDVVAINRVRRVVLLGDDSLKPIVAFVRDGEEVDDPDDADHVVARVGPKKFLLIRLSDYSNGTVH